MRYKFEDIENILKFKTWTDEQGFEHPVGGWQGGRGWQVGNTTVMAHVDKPGDGYPSYLQGGGWMIENVWEALDTVNEWFFDEKQSKLYLIPNGTASGPPTLDYVAVQLETLISINGTKAVPVKNITVQGITFRDAAGT